MLVKPTVTELLKLADDRYELVSITSKRARQLLVGAQALVDDKEYSKVTLAAQEIAAGKVRAIDLESIEQQTNQQQ